MNKQSGKKRQSKDGRLMPRANREAVQLLASPMFFTEFLQAVQKIGLVGEQKNALVVFIVAISRVLKRPLNLIVRGASSSGKNWLVSLVLQFVPEKKVITIDSSSDKAWKYAGSAFRNAVVYFRERNQAAGPVHPMRILISEGRLIHQVSEWSGGKRIKKTHTVEGPVACISTTNQGLTVDDQTRNISIWMDESAEQTRRILRAYGRQGTDLSAVEKRTWEAVHLLLEKRASYQVILPDWFNSVADGVFNADTTVRRYYPAFVEACRTVALIRSFQRDRSASSKGRITLDYADFAIATRLFDNVFVESLSHQDGSSVQIRDVVNSIVAAKDGAPVDAADLETELGISKQAAYARLRQAAQSGAIRRANNAAKNNYKLYLPAPRPRFVPDPEDLFQRLEGVGDTVRFTDPVTGQWVTYTRTKRKAG